MAVYIPLSHIVKALSLYVINICLRKQIKQGSTLGLYERNKIPGYEVISFRPKGSRFPTPLLHPLTLSYYMRNDTYTIFTPVILKISFIFLLIFKNP